MRKMEENNASNIQFLGVLDEGGKGDAEGPPYGGREVELRQVLDELLRFLGEMSVDRHHDYRVFRHRGLRDYLINRFLRMYHRSI
jgi:hypothetical protein